MQYSRPPPHHYYVYLYYLPIALGVFVALSFIGLYFWLTWVNDLEDRWLPYISYLGNHVTDESSSVFLVVMTIAALGYAVIAVAVHGNLLAIIDRHHVVASSYLVTKSAVKSCTDNVIRTSTIFSADDCVTMTMIIIMYNKQRHANNVALLFALLAAVGDYMMAAWPDSMNSTIHGIAAGVVLVSTPVYFLCVNRLMHHIFSDTTRIENIISHNKQLTVLLPYDYEATNKLAYHYDRSMVDNMYSNLDQAVCMRQQDKYLYYRDVLFYVAVTFGVLYFVLHVLAMHSISALFEWSYIFCILLYFATFTTFIKSTKLSYDVEREYV